ncbi:hypothetical protein VTO42DRAFT_7334 [Malbranchea cinnamomea]
MRNIATKEGRYVASRRALQSTSTGRAGTPARGGAVYEPWCLVDSAWPEPSSAATSPSPFSPTTLPAHPWLSAAPQHPSSASQPACRPLLPRAHPASQHRPLPLPHPSIIFSTLFHSPPPSPSSSPFNILLDLGFLPPPPPPPPRFPSFASTLPSSRFIRLFLSLSFLSCRFGRHLFRLFEDPPSIALWLDPVSPFRSIPFRRNNHRHHLPRRSPHSSHQGMNRIQQLYAQRLSSPSINCLQSRCCPASQQQ